MAAKNKYKVTTKFGTFTRSTARTYTHFVITCGYDAFYIELRFEQEKANSEKQLRRYQAGETLARSTGKFVECEDGTSYNSQQWLRATGNKVGTFRTFDARNNESGYRQGWSAEEWKSFANGVEEQLKTWATRKANAQLANQETLTSGNYSIAGWCGRLDLAQKLADTQRKNHYLNVRIIEVATGKEVA